MSAQLTKLSVVVVGEDAHGAPVNLKLGCVLSVSDERRRS